MPLLFVLMKYVDSCIILVFSKHIFWNKGQYLKTILVNHVFLPVLQRRFFLPEHYDERRCCVNCAMLQAKYQNNESKRFLKKLSNMSYIQ